MAAVPSIGRAAGVEPAAVGAEATHGLYERYAGQIYGFCVNRLGSRDEAEDATQSTFLNAHRALKRGVTPEAELAWLFAIAHNVCLTRRRSWSRRHRVESPSDLDAVQDVLAAPTREDADELIRLTDALAHMPDTQRRAILLREWQGLSYHEIAEDMKLSQSAVEALIFRARRSLAANLEVEPRRPRLLSRVRKAFDVGTLLAAAKGLFVTGSAVKATAAAVAVSGAAVIATSVPERPVAASAPPPKASVPLAPASSAPTARLVHDVSPAAHRAPSSRALAAQRPLRAKNEKPAAAAHGKRAAKPLPPGQARKAGVAQPARRVEKTTGPPAHAVAAPKAKVAAPKPARVRAPRPAPPAAKGAKSTSRERGNGNAKPKS